MRKRKRAFTLLEVLVVIGILCLLAGMIFAVASSARASSARTAALSNISQVGKATLLYTGDHDGAFPYGVSADDKFTVCPGDERSPLPLVTEPLATYVKSAEIWRDPLDTGIPQPASREYSEPIECQLPGTRPSLYAKYGSSFVYRGDLAVDHVREPFELVEEGTEAVLDQSKVAIFQDGYGNWHGGPAIPAKRVVALFGDGHAAVSPLVALHQQGRFRSRR